jgi:hypothetical protein
LVQLEGAFTNVAKAALLSFQSLGGEADVKPPKE